MTTRDRLFPGNPYRIAVSRRTVLTAGTGFLAGNTLGVRLANAQDAGDGDRLDWVHMFGEFHLTAAAVGAQVRGGTALYQLLDPVVEAGILTQEIADAFPSFLGAFYAQYLIPDPDNASGATFSTNVGFAIFKVASTEDAKAVRRALQGGYSGRSDARKLSEDESGVAGVSAYRIESTYAGPNGDVPAVYDNWVAIYNDLVVYLSGVAYDADGIGLLSALADAARSLLRRANSAGATLGGLVVPEGQPDASIFVVVHNGRRIDRFEEPSESREITDLIGDVERVSSYRRLQFVAQPTGEGAPPVMFVQNNWDWDEPEDAEAFVARFQDTLAEIDPRQNVERRFADAEDVLAATALETRAKRWLATNNRFQSEPELDLLWLAYYIWEAQENLHVRGVEGYWFDGERFWSYGVVELLDVGSGLTVDVWETEPRARELSRALEEIIEEVTGVDPGEDPDIVNTMAPEEWWEVWDMYYD